MKKIARIHSSSQSHWVGDGFPVRTILSYQTMAQEISPFLLLDYAGPQDFTPSDKPRGVEQHPHRGFETVTIAYQGEVEHKDSAGHSGRIGPGDVQWMTAASGVLHEEMHGQDFTRKGGVFEMIQLWVNLPAKDKMSPPRYQELASAAIPMMGLDDQGSTLRVIAGDYQGVTGAAQTFTPVDLWDIRLKAGHRQTLPVPDGHTTILFVLKGWVTINASETARDAEMVLFEREGDSITIETEEDSTLLLLGGEPIDEPVYGHGPFVMNTKDEIRQAMNDFHAGRF